MSNPLPETVNFPWINKTVRVRVDEMDDLTGEEHLALANMVHWTPALKTCIERACFADYLKMIYAIDATPPTVPVIKAPADIWAHVEIQDVHAEGNFVIVYAMPEWDETLQHEWCIEGTNTLHYVGQFVDWSADGYVNDFFSDSNSAVDYDAVIERLGHIPQAWA
jgi:hypothetical protein